MFLLRWVLNTLVLLFVANLVPGVDFTSFWAALIASLILGLVNAVIRPIMIILTLPINILTFGIFTFIINALMFWLVSTIVKGFDITSFGAAFWGAFAYWIIIMIINYFIEKPAKAKS